MFGIATQEKQRQQFESKLRMWGPAYHADISCLHIYQTECRDHLHVSWVCRRATSTSDKKMKQVFT